MLLYPGRAFDLVWHHQISWSLVFKYPPPGDSEKPGQFRVKE